MCPKFIVENSWILVSIRSEVNCSRSAPTISFFNPTEMISTLVGLNAKLCPTKFGAKHPPPPPILSYSKVGPYPVENPGLAGAVQHTK